MSKPSLSILGSNGQQSVSKRLPQVLVGTSPNPTQKGLELGKSLLDWRKVGRVGWQKQQLAPSGLDSLPNLWSDMTAQIIHDDDLTRIQAGDQDVFHIVFKCQ